MSAGNVVLTEEVRQEIGQHFIPGFVGQEVTEDVVSLIRDYHVGSIIMMKRNIKDIPHVRKLIANLQAVARDAGHEKPLMIGIDQENGLASAFTTGAPLGGTQFPGAMALAATNSTDMAEKVNVSTGREMKLAGVNWAFSPVCDVNSDPRNPVIGVRSFGDDPETVAKFSSAVAQGLTSAGIAPSPKHFPGHGDTHVDSHLGLPRILKTKDEINATELVPFKLLISSEVATIMTGHMALPMIVGDDTPCSLSPKITTDLLRIELGFKGVIVTDCLEMDAILDKYGSDQGAVKALQAGADVAMICHSIKRQKDAIEATYEAVQSGAISLEGLKESGKRIRALKEQFAGFWDEVLKPDLDMHLLQKIKRDNAQVSKDAYQHTIAVIRDTSMLLPLYAWRDKPVTLFTPQMETLNKAVDDPENILRTADGKIRNTAGPSYTAFAAAIHDRMQYSTHVVYSPGDSPPAAFEATKHIIFATRNANRSTWQLEYLQSLLKAVDDLKVVVIATLTPYEILVPVAGPEAAYLCSFEFTPQALKAAVGAMFHESPITGCVPVTSEKAGGALSLR